MKSKTLKTTNLSQERIVGELKTKPTGFFATMFFIGVGLLLFNRVYQAIGMLMVAFSSYALFVAPDKTLMQFTEEYLVLHNRLDHDECKLVYWDEIVSWMYLKRSRYDYLVVELIDGSTERIECYNKLKVENYMRVYAGDKQKRLMKGKKGTS